MTLMRSILSWLLALFIIFVFLHAAVHPLPNPPVGQVKLFDAPGENIVFQTLASKSGLALFEPTGRLVVAAVELVVAALLLLPWTRRLGAIGATLLMAAAVGFHLSPWLGREVPVSLDAGAPTDGGQLFMLSIALLAASLMILVVHPKKRMEPRFG